MQAVLERCIDEGCDLISFDIVYWWSLFKWRRESNEVLSEIPTTYMVELNVLNSQRLMLNRRIDTTWIESDILTGSLKISRFMQSLAPRSLRLELSNSAEFCWSEVIGHLGKPPINLQEFSTSQNDNLWTKRPFMLEKNRRKKPRFWQPFPCCHLYLILQVMFTLQNWVYARWVGKWHKSFSLRRGEESTHRGFQI